MVAMLIKLAIAAIPAAIIVTILVAMAGAVLGGLFSRF